MKSSKFLLIAALIVAVNSEAPNFGRSSSMFIGDRVDGKVEDEVD